MESRKITVINNRSQSQSTVQSTAITLGELKQELRQAGVNYEGMTFFEGHIRAELKDDASILPTNIPYKGEVVNDLTFLLTMPDKKIKSGAMTRAEVNEAIKHNNLQGACIERFGKNYTICSTKDLMDLLSESVPCASHKEEKKKVKKEDPICGYPIQEVDVVEAVNTLALALFGGNLISYSTYSSIARSLRVEIDKTIMEPSKKMSSKEIDDMFDFV